MRARRARGGKFRLRKESFRFENRARRDYIPQRSDGRFHLCGTGAIHRLWRLSGLRAHSFGNLKANRDPLPICRRHRKGRGVLARLGRSELQRFLVRARSYVGQVGRRRLFEIFTRKRLLGYRDQSRFVEGICESKTEHHCVYDGGGFAVSGSFL